MNRPDRRTFFRQSAASGLALVLPCPGLASDANMKSKIKLGMIADLHGGFVKDAESRLDTFLTAMKKEKCDGLVQLGDFAYPNAKHQRYADKFNRAHDVVCHVIGNHEFDYGLKREDCYKAWGIESSYYSRDIAGLRVVVLDGNETGSPGHKGGYPCYIGKDQTIWLKNQLEKSDRPVLVLSHQPLAGCWTVDNAEEIQELLSRYREKVVLCINGHSHIDHLLDVDGIRYLHLNSASYFWVGGKHRTAFYREPLFSVVTVDFENHTLSVSGKASEWKNLSPNDMAYFRSKKELPPEKSVVPEIRNQQISITRSGNRHE